MADCGRNRLVNDSGPDVDNLHGYSEPVRSDRRNDSPPQAGLGRPFRQLLPDGDQCELRVSNHVNNAVLHPANSLPPAALRTFNLGRGWGYCSPFDTPRHRRVGSVHPDQHS